MNFNLDPKINVNVQERCLNWLDLNKTYNIVILKPHKVGTKNILTSTAMLEPNTKYVIIYNFDLDGQTINMPKDCILEINGGDLANGTLVGDYTILLNPNRVDILQHDLILMGKWRDESSLVDEEDLAYSHNQRIHFADKEFNVADFSGLGRVYLRKNIINTMHMNNSWFSFRGYDGLVYVFCIINNKFYHPHTNHMGVILENGLAAVTQNYDDTCLPAIAQNDKLLGVRCPEGCNINDMRDVFIIFPKGAAAFGSSVGNNENDNRDYITLLHLEPGETALPVSTLNNSSICPFNHAQVQINPNNVLEQDMIPLDKTYVRYIIQYDYDLNGETIIIPEGCVLDFQGGSFKNGTILSSKGDIIINDPFDRYNQYGTLILSDTNSTGEHITWKTDYKHVVTSEDKFEDPTFPNRNDTIYFIVEE